MTADASECNGGGAPSAEALEGKLALPLGSAGDRKHLDSADEAGGGRILDASLDGKVDRRPDSRDLESDPLSGGDAEDPAGAIVVGHEKEIRLQGNVDSEEVLVEANGEGQTGEMKGESGEQILVNGRDHREESAAFVLTDEETAENCSVEVLTEMAGVDCGEVEAETLTVKPSGDAEVAEVKASKGEDNKELQRENGHCDLEGEGSSGQRKENGDLSEAEADIGREPLSSENGKEQLDVAAAVQNHDEEEADPDVELKQETENDVAVTEVDHGRKWESSHVSADEESETDQQVESGSEGRQVSLVCAIGDEGRVGVDHRKQLEYTPDSADQKSKTDQQVESGSQDLTSSVGDEVCLEIDHTEESEPSHNAADEKSKIDHQLESGSKEHHVNLMMIVGNERCLEVDHAKESESSHDVAYGKSEIQQAESGSQGQQVNFISADHDKGCLEENHPSLAEPSNDAAVEKSEIDQQVEAGSREHQVNAVSTVGDEGSKGCEVAADEAEHQEELKSADEADVRQDVDAAIIELDHQVELEPERKGQVNETVLVDAGSQNEQEATVEEDVKRNIDIAVKVESESEREEHLTETFITDVDHQLEQKREPSTEPLAENNQEPSEQVVPHAEVDKENQDFVQQVGVLKEVETAAESELQHCHVVVTENPSYIVQVEPIAESGEKQKIENIFVGMAESESACIEDVEPSLGDMVHNVSSENPNTAGSYVPDNNLECHLESNENHEMVPTSDSVTVVRDAETDHGDSVVVYGSDVGISGEVAREVDFKQVGQDISSKNDINDEMGSLELEGSSADASSKDGNEVENRYPEIEQSYSQSGIFNVNQYYSGNQFIKFGEIVANLDEARVPKKGPFHIIRVPRFTGDEHWAKIQQAQDEVDEKTNTRDLINKEVQKQKAICLRVSEELSAAESEELATRAAFEAKRGELNYVHSSFNMLNQARSLEEIDTKIKEMEFNHQHVTMPLKEEKKFMQELKQLRRQREQLSSIMGSKNLIDETLKDEDSIDQKLKDLKKELDSCRSDLAQAEAKTRVARKRYDDEEKVLKNIRKQYDAANEIRQNAFSHMQYLKKESFEKSKYFHKYKNDQTTAKSYASSRDVTSLWLHCSSQVEEVMNLWNNDDEFRKQYVECNKNSVLRRFKTLDSRSLGPDEKPIVPINININKVSTMSVASAKVSQPVTPLVLEDEQEKLKAKEIPPAPQMAQKDQPSKPKKSNATTLKETRDSIRSAVPPKEITSAVSDMEIIEISENAKSMTKEEEEFTRKAEEVIRKEEELKKEKEEAELKERLKLEQRVKAKEAEERKKRQAEKALARAEYRAQKEAELREKKRAKKEKKKGFVDATQIDEQEVTITTTENNHVETFQEQQPDVSVATSLKRTSRPAVPAKQYNRVQPLPLPLRNRGKRKMHTWMWALLTAMLVIILFLSGNYISTSTFSLPGFGF